MPSYQQLQSDMTAALKAGDKTRTGTLRLLYSALQQQQIDGRKELSEADVIAAIQKQVKQRKDSIDQYRQGNREDLVAKEQAELAILEEYLPRMMGEAEIEAEVRAILAEKGLSGPSAVGAVMKEFMARHRGRADGKSVQQVAGRLVAG